MRARFTAFFGLLVPALTIACLGACSKSDDSGPTASHPDAGAVAIAGDSVLLDLTADLESPDHFFDFPWPSDLRLTKAGTPDIVGFPNPSLSSIVEGIRTIAAEDTGFPVVPVAWFQFAAPLAPQDPTVVIAADKTSPYLLIDVDPSSPTRGALTPTIAQTLDNDDNWVPPNVVAIGPRPGFVLSPKRKYAYVVLRSANDANGAKLGVPAALANAIDAPTSTDPLAQSLAPLWPALKTAGVSDLDVAAATVFTTGDVVADLADLSSRVRAAYSTSITGASVDPTVLDSNDRMCELQAQVSFPQFQTGAPPYDTGGLFTIGADGLPVKQSDMVVPVTITIPKQPMPAGGYPLVLFFHGTGGVSTAIADRGVWHYATDALSCPNEELDTWNGMTGCNTAGEGPGWVMAARGFAEVAAALPVNPQRWPAGANGAFPEYINVNNIAPTRDIFRQGVIEQRMFIDALERLTIAPSQMHGCTGTSLPAGETAYHFRTDKLVVHGQSMGAMYANLISAVEPRIHAVVATGAGGYWSYFILLTQTIPGIKGDLQFLLDTPADYTHLHPVMHLAQMGLGPIDPILFMPRVGANPLPGFPARPVYEPHGEGDSYFPTIVQDAVALAYRNQEAGDVQWPTMQQALALAGDDGIAPYPVTNDKTSANGSKYTGVVVQYQGDGIYDPHAIYSQLDAVKYQYGCFLETTYKTGTATVPAPAPYTTPCAGE
jgi:hypothetical protein